MFKNRPKTRFALKLLLAAALLYWIIDSGKLDLESFTFLVSSPVFLPVNIVILAVSSLFLGAARFQLMLRLCSVDIPYPRAVRFQGIGLFANLFLPSSVGGDALKTYYVKGDKPEASLPKLILAVLLDRIVGMMSLFMVGLAVAASELDMVLRLPDLRSLFILNLVLFSGMFGFFTICHFIHRHEAAAARVIGVLEHRIPALHKAIALIKSATVLIGKSPGILLVTIGISVMNQLMMVFLFWLATRLFGDQDIPVSTIALIYPLGALITVVPLTPGGIGVGHLAFDKLFHLFGFDGGANYFNIYFCGGILFNLSMIVFYLGHRRAGINAVNKDSSGSQPLEQVTHADARG